MDTKEPESDPALDYELPSSFALCWKTDEVAQFPTIEKAVAYGKLEFDSFYVVRVQTGEVVANQCLHEKQGSE